MLSEPFCYPPSLPPSQQRPQPPPRGVTVRCQTRCRRHVWPRRLRSTWPRSDGSRWRWSRARRSSWTTRESRSCRSWSTSTATTPRMSLCSRPTWARGILALDLGGRPAAGAEARGLQGLRPLRARAPRRLRVGERPHRAPHVRHGPGDLAQEPLTSSGIDVWVKRTRKLVINDWYMMDDYHRDTGEGATCIRSASARLRRRRRVDGRQAGGVAQLHDVARAGGTAPSGWCWSSATRRGTRQRGKLSTKGVALDAGSRLESRRQHVAHQWTRRPRERAAPPPHQHPASQPRSKSSMYFATTSAPAGSGHGSRLKNNSGNLGCGVVVGPGVEWKATATDNLLISKATPGGSSSPTWAPRGDRNGGFADAAAWTKRVGEMAAPGRGAGPHHAVGVAPGGDRAGPAGNDTSGATHGRRGHDRAAGHAHQSLALRHRTGALRLLQDVWSPDRRPDATSTTSRRPSTS